MRGGPYETASSLSSEKRDTPRDSATVQIQIALRLLDQRAHDALVQQPSVDRWTKTTERVPETGEVTWPRSRRRPRRGRTRRLSWSASNCSGDNSETVGERRAAPWLLGGVLRRRYAGAHVYPLAWHRVLMLYFRVDIIRCLSPWRRSWPVWASVPWWADDRRPDRRASRVVRDHRTSCCSRVHPVKGRQDARHPPTLGGHGIFARVCCASAGPPRREGRSRDAALLVDLGAANCP